MAKKQILLNAFNMNCVGHINHGLWTHPRDTSTQYKTLEYWTDLAKLLERGLFDGLFLADIVGVYDVYQDSADLTLRESIQLPVNDPLLTISAMAAATRHLGFGVTVNLTYEAPYLLARRFSTLDHLTHGRVGWNIVTGYLESAARAMGLSEQIAHDERYDRADEFLEVAYKLWEESWDRDAVKADKRARVYADPAAVRRVDHQGKYYKVQGFHLSEPSPQRALALYQTAIFGGLAAGSFMWGHFAGTMGVSGALSTAGIMLGITVALLYRSRLPEHVDTQSLARVDSTEPAMAAAGFNTQHGSVLVAVEYLIERDKLSALIGAAHPLRLLRLRNGAQQWQLFRDLEREGVWREVFLVESWMQYLRMIDRMTLADKMVLDEVRALHSGDKPPVVSRNVSYLAMNEAQGFSLRRDPESL